MLRRPARNDKESTNDGFAGISFMKHGISDQEWIDYIDSRATAEVSDRIVAHITGCMSCWEFYEQISCSTQALREAGEEARQQLTLGDRQLHRLLRGVFSHLRNDEAVVTGHAQVRGRIDRLETVLVPFCGAQVAARALHTAAKDSPANSLEQVTHENWEPFMERLTRITAAICGDTFASLIRETGRY